MNKIKVKAILDFEPRPCNGALKIKIMGHAQRIQRQSVQAAIEERGESNGAH
jgi:hypothetical protein